MILKESGLESEVASLESDETCVKSKEPSLAVKAANSDIIAVVQTCKSASPEGKLDNLMTKPEETKHGAVMIERAKPAKEEICCTTNVAVKTKALSQQFPENGLKGIFLYVLLCLSMNIIHRYAHNTFRKPDL